MSHNPYRPLPTISEDEQNKLDKHVLFVAYVMARVVGVPLDPTLSRFKDLYTKAATIRDGVIDEMIAKIIDMDPCASYAESTKSREIVELLESAKSTQ